MMQLAQEGSHADFSRKARDAGKPILRRSFDADYFQRWSEAQADQALDVWVGETLAMVDRIVASERAFVAAMMH
jgi:hypothetical protein